MKIKHVFLVLGTAGLTACSTIPETNSETETQASSDANTEMTVAAPDTMSPTEQLEYISNKYEQIEYGQALSEVCSKPFPAEGKLTERPNMQIMWENYLYDRPDGIWGEIGGMVEVNGNLPLDQGRWTNACTVRLSHMLNQAGHKIPREGNKTVSGGNKDQYYYRLRDFETYLLGAFGEPDLAILDGSADSFDLPDRPGIVLMDFPGSTFFGHVTIWNGAGSVDNADIGGHRVLFWDLPCFVPNDRDSDQSASLEASP